MAGLDPAIIMDPRVKPGGDGEALGSEKKPGCQPCRRKRRDHHRAAALSFEAAAGAALAVDIRQHRFVEAEPRIEPGAVLGMEIAEQRVLLRDGGAEEIRIGLAHARGERVHLFGKTFHEADGTAAGAGTRQQQALPPMRLHPGARLVGVVVEFRHGLSLAAPEPSCYTLGPMTALRRPALFCAFDTPDLAIAESLGQRLAGAVDGVKLGLEFFTAQGPEGVRRLQRLGLPVFLDLKLHDIPNTVEGAARVAGSLGVQILTVHGSGGRAMLEAADRGARAGAAEAGVAAPAVVAISVLTSLGEPELAEVGQQGPVAAQAERLALLAKSAGLAGIVGSAAEVASFRRLLGPQALLVVPGIRPADSAVGDQKRVATPGDAVKRGADVLVVGRPITGAGDPAAAARAIRTEMDAALAGAAS